MNNIITSDGYIKLINQEGDKVLVGQLRHGITFNLFKSEPKKVSCVEFKHRNLTDTFYFHHNKPVFHHITTRDTIPELTRVYLSFFLEEQAYKPEAFISFVVNNYFIKQLGFSEVGQALPESL